MVRCLSNTWDVVFEMCNSFNSLDVEPSKQKIGCVYSELCICHYPLRPKIWQSPFWRPLNEDKAAEPIRYLVFCNALTLTFDGVKLNGVGRRMRGQELAQRIPALYILLIET